MVMTKPLLLLDVDGPLNPYAAKPSRRPEGYETHRLVPTGHNPRKPFRVWLNPSHGPSLLALPFDLVWCTTWEHDANRLIGPNIGLPELPVLEFPPALKFRNFERDEDGTYWKTHTVVEWAAGRPFAWVDDEIRAADHEYIANHHRGAAMAHQINPAKGLLPENFDILKVWAKRNGN
jgi:hypothetical protein